MSDQTDEPTLQTVAEGLLGDLRKLEDTIREAQRLEINSAKNLQRGRRLLEACSDTEQRLAGHLQQLATAIQSTQLRIAGCMEHTVDFSKHVAARAEVRAMSAMTARAAGRSRPTSHRSSTVVTFGSTANT